METSLIDRLIETVDQELIPKLQIESIAPHDPVKVSYLPHPWPGFSPRFFRMSICYRRLFNSQALVWSYPL